MLNKDFFNRETNITAKVVCDSISEQGYRCSVKEGCTYETKSNGSLTVVEILNKDKIKVRFNDKGGYETVTREYYILKGSVKNYFYPRVCGVGYIGVGVFGSMDSNRQIYLTWCEMLRRCYSVSFKERCSTYENCTVCEDWHNFQNFAKWYTKQKFYAEGYDLDKDVLVKGNKIYSEKTCALVPNEINKLLLDSRKTRGDNPQGVSFVKEKGLYRASMRKFGKVCFLGYYNTKESAAERYAACKEAHVKDVAIKWKDRVDDSVFNALISWSL